MNVKFNYKIVLARPLASHMPPMPIPIGGSGP